MFDSTCDKYNTWPDQNDDSRVIGVEYISGCRKSSVTVRTVASTRSTVVL